MIESLSAGAKAKIAAFVNMMRQFTKSIDGRIGPLTELIFVESGLKDFLQASSKDDTNAADNVNELISAIHTYDSESENPSLLDYLQQISLFSDVDSYDTSADRAALLTMHSAKGLEFENVFIVGLEEGLLPHERSFDDNNEIEEERRLFFVGMTRAKSALYISLARYRTIRGQMLRTIPSQFLYELGIDFRQQERDGEFFEDVEAADYYDDTSQAVEEFGKNQLVMHKKFGAGIIEEFRDKGENSVVVVRFNTGRRRTLMLKYANLIRMTNP